MPRRKIEPPAGTEHSGSKLHKELPPVCQQIRFYREKLGLEQKALAAQLKIAPTCVSNWENGRSRPDINLLPAICRVLRISLYQLFQLKEPTPPDPPFYQKFVQNYTQLSEGHQYAVDQLIASLLKIQEEKIVPELRVLQYFHRSLAAGTGDPTEFEQDTEPVYVYASSVTEHGDSIFTVNGDSMEPAFHHGDDVLVQRLSGGGLHCGEIGAFIVGNETYIKQYEKDGLHSLNPRYPVMHFAEEEVYLIGKVIGVLPADSYASQEDIQRFRQQLASGK